VTLFERHHASL